MRNLGSHGRQSERLTASRCAGTCSEWDVFLRACSSRVWIYNLLADRLSNDRNAKLTVTACSGWQPPRRRRRAEDADARRTTCSSAAWIRDVSSAPQQPRLCRNRRVCAAVAATIASSAPLPGDTAARPRWHGEAPVARCTSLARPPAGSCGRSAAAAPTDRRCDRCRCRSTARCGPRAAARGACGGRPHSASSALRKSARSRGRSLQRAAHS